MPSLVLRRRPRRDRTVDRVLEEAEWRAAVVRHATRLGPVVRAHLERQARGASHPVYDFLFAYYELPPGRLLRWSPGLGVTLCGAADAFLADHHFARARGGVALNPETFPLHRLRAAQWIRDLLEVTAAREPRFGCSGLHEWAMIYQAPEVRHKRYPLRMTPPEITAFVQAQNVCCSHYDAFRFFTPAARPLNRLPLARTNRHDMEQRGCLHVNMDLYKWAYKFQPWIPADLMADAFLLAVALREVDMRASPYDLSALGFPAIPIETPEGRAVYRQQQMRLAEEARPLRVRLLHAYRSLCEAGAGAVPP